LIVTGYHGTTQQRAEQILSHGFRLSTNPWEWLGDGVYFWQDAPTRAVVWSEEWSKRSLAGTGDLAVLRCTLRLEDCLDLLDVKFSDVIRELSGDFLQLLQSKPNVPKLVNYRTGAKRGRHELDAAFFNYLVAYLAEKNFAVRCLRAAISEGEPILPGSPICYRSHVQICIRDVNLIDAIDLM
jgi:hypothetical protein